ncbi:MAG: gephyrin-like molybdotransferase Glp [Polyangiales bacterium]
MKTRQEALGLILEQIRPLNNAETVSIHHALGRTLAAPLHAAMAHPPFAQSAMDGWSVHSDDVFGASPENPVRLPIVGESRAGGVLIGPQAKGTAVRIFTGAPLPEGADAVVIQEDASIDGSDVSLRFASPRAHHVRAEGASRNPGALLVEHGTRVDAGVLSAFASEGLEELQVVRRPKVVVISTGDEVHPLGSPLPPGRVFNSNGIMLRALAEEAGAHCVALHCGDSVDEMVALLGTLDDADLILTCGGASVGDHDLVRASLVKSGVKDVFWKVAVKPGKPVAFGLLNGRPVLSLPGNPVSAFVTFHLFASPAIRQMLGARARAWVRATLSDAISHRPGREEFVRSKLVGSAELVVSPFQKQNSGAMHDLALADALVRLPADQEHFPVGSRLETLLLRGPHR